MEEGFAFSQALIHQGFATLGSRGFGDQGIYASAYDEPVKYGFIVIAIVRTYATEIWAAHRPFLCYSKWLLYKGALPEGAVGEAD